ncbi:MAG: isocitrate/isopropylmalate dehydrogenase family protein, partial [Oscillospiraceae bacterium]|nr:isocitrate/isopropylmalate dehydrogenase family protein [Oscillospiraceae bacterium]
MTHDLTGAVGRFTDILNAQLARAERLNSEGDFIDYQALDKLIVGVCGGDGIGPAITAQSERVLRILLRKEIETGKVEFRAIDSLTIERRAAERAAIPAQTLGELKECHVILKGPTTTP